MQTTALLRFPSSLSLISHPSSKFSCYSLHKIKCSNVSSNVQVNGGKSLSAKEKRQLRNERREEAINSNPPWPEVVKERLSTPPKKLTQRQLLDFDTLADQGVRWWKVSVRRTSERSAAKKLFAAFRGQYPHAELEIFVPEIPFRKQLENGSYSNSTKLMLPGYIFIKCLLNKEIHNFIRYFPSIRGFSGTRVGSSMRPITRPAPIFNLDMEILLKRFHEEQEKSNHEIENEPAKEKINKSKDNLVRQGQRKTRRKKNFSVAKNADFLATLAKELSKIKRRGIQVGSSDAKFNSKKGSEVFADTKSTQYANEPSFKGLRKQKNSNGRDRFPSKQESKLIAGSTVKATSGHIKEFDLET